MKYLAVFLILVFSYRISFSQSDSITISKNITSIIELCQQVDFSDPKILQLGVYYKAANFIGIKKNTDSTYSKVNYAVKEEKKYTDGICRTILEIVSRNEEWKTSSFYKTNSGAYRQKIIYRNSVYEAYSYIEFIFRKIGKKYLLVGIE